ncbi:MAG: PilW family protein [Desulfococcaceae bacterium]
MKEKIIGKQGFTLIELIIALLISTVVMIAIYLTFASQEKSQMTQKQITEMQQNIRAAMHIMSNEIRLAGHDKSLAREAEAGLIEAGPGRIRFDMDICLTDGTPYNDKGTPEDLTDDTVPDEKTDGPNEDVTYAFDDADDTDGNGMIDNSSADFEKLILRRETCPTDLTCSGLQPFSEFIQGIRFTYFNAGGGVITGTGTGGFLSDDQMSQVRSIRIAILGRTKRDIREIPDTQTYDMNGTDVAGGIVGPFNDTFRRRLLITTIKCRNLGVSLE